MATKRNQKSDMLSITGLSAEVRETIAEAARKQRRSVNAWAASELRNAARAALAGGGAAAPSDEVLAQLKSISRKLDRLSARPKPVEEAIGRMQKRLHEMGDQLGSAFDEMRGRGSETLDEVREHGNEVTEKAAEAVTQWRKVADGTLHDLQRNLNDLQKSVMDMAGLAPPRKGPKAAEKEPSAKAAAAVPRRGPSNAGKKAARPTAGKRPGTASGRNPKAKG